MSEDKNDWKKYVIVFFITLFIFITAFWISNLLGDKKLEEIKSTEDSIFLDILSLETQFDLLQETPCKSINESILSKELNELASKIEYGENNFENLDEELIGLKKYYSLLQIKDFLLMQKASSRCNLEIESIIYFYGREDCKECQKQGFVLTDLRQEYPTLRVYSFDYYLDLSAISALKSIYKIDQNLPALIIDGVVYKGFKSIEEIEEIIPELKKIREEKEKLNELEQAKTESKELKN